MAKEGFLDRFGKTKVGSLFVNVDDEGDVQEMEATVSSAASTQSASPQFQTKPVPVSRPVMSFVPSRNVDPQVRAKIELIAKNTDQVSYTKFTELLAVMMATFPGDENTARKAALQAAKASGYPVVEIIRGLDAVLGQLKKTEEQFKNAVPARISAKVGSRKQKIGELQQASDNTKQSLASVQAELARLQAQRADIENKIQTETASISMDEQSIREDETKFSIAMDDVRGVYLAERQKLESFKEGT